MCQFQDNDISNQNTPSFKRLKIFPIRQNSSNKQRSSNSTEQSFKSLRNGRFLKGNGLDQNESNQQIITPIKRKISVNQPNCQKQYKRVIDSDSDEGYLPKQNKQRKRIYSKNQNAKQASISSKEDEKLAKELAEQEQIKFGLFYQNYDLQQQIMTQCTHFAKKIFNCTNLSLDGQQNCDTKLNNAQKKLHKIIHNSSRYLDYISVMVSIYQAYSIQQVTKILQKYTSFEIAKDLASEFYYALGKDQKRLPKIEHYYKQLRKKNISEEEIDQFKKYVQEEKMYKIYWFLLGHFGTLDGQIIFNHYEKEFSTKYARSVAEGKKKNIQNILKTDQSNKYLKLNPPFKQKKNGHITKAKRIWYTQEGNKKLYYSDLGNKKIQQALKNGKKEIQLNNEDINLTILTHRLDFQNKTMTHKVSGTSFPIKQLQNKISFTLNGVQKSIPDTQYKKIPKTKFQMFWKDSLTDCELSIGFYKIDLVNKTQTNLFSNFQRNIASEEVSETKKFKKYYLKITYNVETSKLKMQYVEENQNLVKSQKSTQQNLKSKFINRTKALNNKSLTSKLISIFEEENEKQNIFIQQSQDEKSLILRVFNEKNISNFLRVLSHSAVSLKKEIIYSRLWVPQISPIQTFIVVPNSNQFNKVQNTFTAGKIVQLIRIQNKLIYKKYYDQRQFLKEINGGKQVKQMFLYHGTGITDPKIIYEDKEESFNINYTRENNLLGKGIYFAERSEYSVSYSYKENQQNQENIRSMLMCRVLVGDSEKCSGHNGDIRDTSFKDPVNKIRYESMTDFLQGSNVFVVYKNRRAYPFYLIKYKKNEVQQLMK